MGEESYYVDLIADYITENVLTETELLTVVYGADVDVATVINAAKRYPMMSEYQVVVVKRHRQSLHQKNFHTIYKKPLNSILIVCRLLYWINEKVS